MNNQEVHNLFYVPPEKIHAKTIKINGTEFHHIKNVMRKKIGDRLHVTDGKGSSYQAVITSISRDSISVDITEKKCFERTANCSVDLAFVPVKGNRNDFTIEKCTELGVRKFVLFTSANSVVRDLSVARVSRYEKIAISAMLQSQQYYLPEIATSNNIFKLFKEYDTIAVADMQGPREVQARGSTCLFITGPEGGFNTEEIQQFNDNGARLLSLGRTRLRSETAAIAGIVKILAAYRHI